MLLGCQLLQSKTYRAKQTDRKQLRELIILSFLFLAVGLILKFMNLRHKQLVQLMRNAIK